MCEPPKEQKTAEHVDQPVGPALKLGHGAGGNSMPDMGGMGGMM